MSQHNQMFLDLRPQMLNQQCKDCFDILSPYFPTVHPEIGFGTVNLEHGYKHGGTAICNYNMLPAEARSVVDTLDEIGCGCLFVVPVPVSGLLTEEYLGVGAGSAELAHRTQQQVRAAFLGAWVKFPPYFSIHMYGAPNKPACRSLLRELLVQNLVTHSPQSATAGAKDKEVATLLSRFTLRNRT